MTYIQDNVYVTIPEDLPFNVDLRSLVADILVSGTIFRVTQANNGNAEILNDGTTARFTPTIGFGATRFSYSIEVPGGIVRERAVNIFVNNIAPAISSISGPIDPNVVTTAIAVSANFTDPGTLDTHTAVWAWGDGTTSSGNVTQANGSVTGSHIYATPGVYTITLTVTDDDGGVAQSTYQYIVIYDPSAGFVTGGGWFNSPAGAYTANSALVGKATFGFNSKYKNGATVPTGNTEFQFKVADFNFKSTSYEWLVVSGAKARFRGVGTVNGAVGYGFELTAWDGQVNGGGGVDRFRIKIWLGNLGNGVVYDNMLGAADGADPTTALGGGSIVIHKNAQSLLASGGVALGMAGGTLTQVTLNQAIDHAINYWHSSGIDANAISNLRQIHVQVAELSGAELGIASDTNYVWIDRDAAGFGWQLDPVGTTNPSFTGGMHLLSVVTHELGHKLGLEHGLDDSDLMAPRLRIGERTLAGARQSSVYFGPGWVFPESLRSDVVRLGIRDAVRSLEESSEESEAHDQLFASLDSGPAKPRWRIPALAHQLESDARQISDPHREDLLTEDLIEEIALARFARQIR